MSGKTSHSGITASAPAGVRSTGPSQPPPAAMVIFGITGDLAHRKLVPALYELESQGLLPDGLAIVGFSRRARDAGAVARDLRGSVVEQVRRNPFDESIWQRFAARLECVAGSYDDAEAFRALDARLDAIDRRFSTGGNRLYYLAVPPDGVPMILANLAGAGLLQPRAGRRTGEAAGRSSMPFSRVVIEKPFGRDLGTARDLNKLVGGLLDESQVFRIDHYLGKETVQNILVFRLGNAIFEPLWNRKYVDHIQITAAETIGVGSRGAFYDETGVIRDIVQNHLLQVLALCTMEPPLSFAADDVRDQKLMLLRALRRVTTTEARELMVRGQYRGYRDEGDVASDSQTPTYVAMKLAIDNWRWQGVPVFLRAGKRLARRVTEVAIQFKTIPLCLFGNEEVCRRVEPNVLVLRLQPDEGISLRFGSKIPGETLDVGTVVMDFSYAESFDRRPSDAYERLLLEALRGDQTLFTRSDSVERSWDVVAPFIEAIEVAGDPRRAPTPVPVYEPGSDGPAEADRLIRGQARRWRSLG